MVAKPYSSSHIAAVSSHFTTMRLSGDVKDRLVTLLCEELDRLVPRMEDETLTKTLNAKPSTTHVAAASTTTAPVS